MEEFFLRGCEFSSRNVFNKMFSEVFITVIVSKGFFIHMKTDVDYFSNFAGETWRKLWNK
jgi:hypothetical protein